MFSFERIRSCDCILNLQYAKRIPTTETPSGRLLRKFQLNWVFTQKSNVVRNCKSDSFFWTFEIRNNAIEILCSKKWEVNFPGTPFNKVQPHRTIYYYPLGQTSPVQWCILNPHVAKWYLSWNRKLIHWEPGTDQVINTPSGWWSTNSTVPKY